jgi:ABC-type sugar transport system substrate-binding protein
MATPAERMRALRERARRGVRRLTIDVSEDDLRAIAKRGYEGAVTTDHDQQAQAVGLFLTDALLANLTG